LCTTVSRTEHFTTLGAWLTRNGQPLTVNNGVISHKDQNNCGSTGCDATVMLNHISEMDGDLFSLKFVGNPRASIGREFIAERDALGISKAILRFGKQIDNKTKKPMKGRHHGNLSTTMTWRRPEHMFLTNDFGCWCQSLNLRRKCYTVTVCSLNHINLPTAITRDSWLSPLTHWHHKFWKLKTKTAHDSALT